MIRKLLTFLLLFPLSLFANNYYLLGSKQQSQNQTINSKNTIVWNKLGDEWSVSLPQETIELSKLDSSVESHVLINNNEVSYDVSSYSKEYYDIQKGWNYLPSHINGVDVNKTFFEHKDVEFVYVYEKRTEVWALYSPSKSIQDKMYETRLLLLKNIEPNIGFYVYAKKALKVKIRSIGINKSCQKIIATKEYDTLLSSGNTQGMVFNSEESMGVKSRYFSHHRRGVYDDTRVLFIYKKPHTKQKAVYKYGPALPKVQLKFSKEYEGETFYMYNYKNRSCYKGVFPSIKIPPLSSLKLITDL